ncbi:hypothetical protein LDENG_00186420 [Lucifuga dentata]|nr:hypothetical protein LDENG_00186420 [Lucifuga dentata]
MSVLKRSMQLVSSVFKSSVFLERTGVLRSVCSIPAGYGQILPPCFIKNSASCHHVPTSACDFSSKRCYSEVFNESSGSKQNAGDSEEEAEGMERYSNDAGLNLKSLQDFSLDVVVSLLRQENAVDICVIKVPEHIRYTEHFIVVSGISPRHLRAMALYAIKVYKFVKKAEDPHVKIEGKDSEDWMCIDFGKIVVHFMLPETRDIYELEKLWTLRTYDEQLKNIPAETLPEDFIYGVEVTK